MTRYSRRRFLGYSSATLATSLLLKACGTQTNTATTDEVASTDVDSEAIEQLRVAMVLPGIITDKAWNQAGYGGLEVIKENPGVETAYVEQVGQPDQVEALTDFARRGYQLVFAHGGQFDASIEQVAAEFPDTFFVGVNGAVSGDNYASLRLDTLQSGYLIGVLAGLLTQTNKLAYITAQEFESTKQELEGFEMGAKSINPEIEVVSSFTGDWNDAAKAKEATASLISSGADVVHQWLDNASPAVLRTASDEGVYTFGNTVDQLEIAPEAVVTSAVKRIDLAIAYIAELAANNELEGQIYIIGFDQPDILYLGEFGADVPEAIQQQAQETQQALANNEIQLT